MKNTVLAIDDDPMVLDILQGAIGKDYTLLLAADARSGLALATSQPPPDIVLLDVKLPDRHGYDVCQMLKQNQVTENIPVIFLTSHSDVDNITRGLALGAVDYVSKPFNLPILMARLKTHLRLAEANHLLKDQNAHLESLVRLRTRDLQMSHDLSMMALGSIAETRDNETGNHIHRTRSYVQVMCDNLSGLERFRHSMNQAIWTDIVKSSPLHDIGKVGIPDHILLKPGKLSVEEFEQMKRHPVIGRDALRSAEARLGSGRSFLGTAMEIAYSHHERWDGTGYPEGKAGTAIPISGRIMAVADVYDALISKRAYKSAMTHETAVALIREGRGSHFDPLIVDCFLENAGLFESIADQYRDAATGVH